MLSQTILIISSVSSDDKLIERIYDNALQITGQVLFGKGCTKFASGSVVKNAHAGIGVSATATTQVYQDGLLQFGGDVSDCDGVNFLVVCLTDVPKGIG